MKTLYDIIKERGLKVIEAAKEMDVNKSYLSGVITGARRPTRFTKLYFESWAKEPLNWEANDRR